MRKLALALILAFNLIALAQQNAAETSAPDAQEIAAVKTVLTTQVEAWNRGDLEGYMAAGYWKSPELTFIGGATEIRGYDAALERYRKAYQAPGKEMGHLDFPEMRVVMLGSDAALATGRFHLKMKDGREPSGRFTVILRKFPEGWRIIHDHSCAG
ncbi:MAG TPA: AtzH-like domain-containing protein [Terriglobales bacterium]|nr:AtzH-like domain-containing protein [Terriglobales bacterium]